MTATHKSKLMSLSTRDRQAVQAAVALYKLLRLHGETLEADELSCVACQYVENAVEHIPMLGLDDYDAVERAVIAWAKAN